MLKRLLDIFASATGLVICSPVFLILTIAVKLSSKGPVFYQGLRVGRYGKRFSILKFRSMVVDAEKYGGSSTSNSDPRITSIGRFMRKCKLDELPQLINVLQGEMSIVGPRPEVQQYVNMYTEDEKFLLEIRPGITDWASIWNSDEGSILAGHEDPDKAYEELIRPTKLQLQLYYAHHHTPWVDLKIIFYTFFKLLNNNYTPREIRLALETCQEINIRQDNFDTVTELPGHSATKE
jgi:lipopolysaccharide/colanic/teichoic acid biosynthesis glycosyltransferase